MTKRDEGAVTVGTRGWVRGLTIPQIDVTVVEIQVLEEDGNLYANCADSSGNTRWRPIEDVNPWPHQDG